jgi:hypothetical protein
MASDGKSPRHDLLWFTLPGRTSEIARKSVFTCSSRYFRCTSTDFGKYSESNGVNLVHTGHGGLLGKIPSWIQTFQLDKSSSLGDTNVAYIRLIQRVYSLGFLEYRLNWKSIPNPWGTCFQMEHQVTTGNSIVEPSAQIVRL